MINKNIEKYHLIKTFFICGVSKNDLIEKIKDEKNNKNLDSLIPNILFSFPENKENISNSILDFIFIDGINIIYQNVPSKFYCFVLTNERGVRSYIYILKIYENLKINNKSFYIPYCFCIWSSINNPESFKKILMEMNKIIKSNDNNLSEETLINFHNCELLNLIVFISDVIIPSNYSKLILNFHFSSVKFYFPSFFEIPCNNNEQINILFNCLEISTIIKLWCSILNEKYVILIADQAYLLFSVFEALLSLIFPFKWLNTYIPILPSNLLDYLESPSPYLIGVLKDKIDYFTLNEMFSNYVICDLNTSMVNSNGISTLPRIKEENLRKKLNYILHPEIFELEEIFDNEEDKINYNLKNFNIEDIDKKKLKSVNIQYVFFRVFRDYLKLIIKNYKNNDVFKIQNFLDEYCDENMRDFLDKLSSTSAFDQFLENFNNLDDYTFSRICANIVNPSKSNEIENGITKNKNPLIIQMNLPNNINFILNNFSNEQIKYQNLDSLKIDYSLCLNNFINIRYSIPSDDKKILWKKKCKNKQELNSMDLSFINNKNNSIGQFYPNTMPNNNNLNGRRKKSFFNKNSFNNFCINLDNNLNSTIKSNTSNKSISKALLKENNYFFIYSNNNEKNSINNKNNFLNFINFIFETLNLKDKLKNENRKLMLNELNDIINNKFDENISFNNSSQILEISNESFNSSYSNNNIEKDLIRFSSNNNNNQNKNIFYFNDVKCYQFYLYSCFALEDLNKNFEKNQIIKLYEKAYILNKNSFCRGKFFQFLDNFNLFELNLLNAKLSNNNENMYYILIKIIKHKINRINKNKKNLERKESIISFSSNNSNINLNNNVNKKEEFKKENSFLLQTIDNHINKTKSLKRRNTVDLKRFIYHQNKLNNNYSQDLDRNSKSINDVFDIRTNGEKIVEQLKINNDKNSYKNIKMNVINSYTKFKHTKKDPLFLIEDISVRLYSLIIKNCLNKISIDLISKKLLLHISNSKEFLEIKYLVAELQAIKLDKINENNNFKTCFWLNIYNFLIIFTIILKNEILLTYYEWYKLQKNSFFNIGGYDISLYEIHNIILQNNQITKELYGESIDFNLNDEKNDLKVNFTNKYLFFAISLPMKDYPNLQIYFPSSLNNQIYKNVIDYFNTFIKIDKEKKNIKIPEYLIWMDEHFFDNIKDYNE